MPTATAACFFGTHTEGKSLRVRIFVRGGIPRSQHPQDNAIVHLPLNSFSTDHGQGIAFNDARNPPIPILLSPLGRRYCCGLYPPGESVRARIPSIEMQSERLYNRKWTRRLHIELFPSPRYPMRLTPVFRRFLVQCKTNGRLPTDRIENHTGCPIPHLEGLYRSP